MKDDELNRMDIDESKKISSAQKPIPIEERKGVMIGIITRRLMPSKFIAHMEHWRSNLPPGLFWSIHYVIGKSYDEARNDCVEAAYRKGVRWLLFIDDDVLLPLDALPKLLAHKKDIITGVYWMKHFPPQPLLFKKLGDGPIYDFKPGELLEIEGGGLGCCLIEMRVFDKLKKPYFKCDWTYTDKSGRTFKVPIGEDHYFYIHAKEAGFEVWADTDILCDHYDVKTDNFFPGDDVVREITSKKLRSVGLGGKVGMIDGLRTEEAGRQTIVFYTDTALAFDGSSLEAGPLGGSETDVINLAKKFKLYGFNVKVFCRTLNEGTFDGVSYIDFNKFNPTMKMDVFIASRSMGIFRRNPLAAKKIMWMHDMPRLEYQLDKIPNIDIFVALSEFHKKETVKLFPSIESKIIILENGIDTARFKSKNIPRDPMRLIYSSTPFRGLDILLELFPKIREQVPEAKLYVFSGMSLYGMGNSPELQKIIDKAKTMEGVIYSEPVNQYRLAEEMMQSALLVYPSTFPETFCNTVNEAITAGTPIVTTNLGALPETVGTCGICIDKELTNWAGAPVNWKQDFINAVIRLLKDEGEYKIYQNECRKKDTSWITVKDKWLNIMFPERANLDPFSSDYWDMVYSNEIKLGKNRDSPGRWKEIEEQIPSKQSKILDYGCGSGEFLKYLSNKGYTDLYAYDISKVAIEETLKKSITKVVSEDILREKDVPTYDVINLSHVLEHLDNDILVAKKMIKYLNPKGKLIISVPVEDEPYWEHKRIYTSESVITLAQATGLGFNMTQRISDQINRDGSRSEEIILILNMEG
jgi:glycosyltransferase involved in cell wall biosynthesis/2-polyprenyl-3-methyl-5-hydroxy-6-metoxy-1,4-benzoquinol methylase